MKRLRNLTFTLWLIALLGSGCATAYRENKSEEQPVELVLSDEELDEQFTSEQLSKARLTAMEARARQKLQDFIDYLNIIANPTLDSTFRKEAVQQAERLFVDPQAKVNLSSDSQATEAPTVHRWLEALRRANEPQSFVTDEPVVIQPLTADEDYQYRGTLAFTLLANATPTDRQADVLVKKVYKEFGREKEWVWEMFLEDIR